MGANRLNFDGYVDYSFATFEEIVSDIRSLVVGIPRIIKKLLKLKKEVVKESSRLDDPNSILNYVEYCTLLFKRFEDDFKRLLVEIPSRLNNQHIVMLRNIIVRSRHEELECCIGFKREHIARTLKDESSRDLVGKIYVITRDLLSLVGNMGGIENRLKSFIGRVPRNKKTVPLVQSIISNEKAQKDIAKNIDPFPSPEGISWNDVKITFLSNVAVAISAGTSHLGREYTALGFMDQRNGECSILWLALASFGKCKGEISRRSTGLNTRITRNLKAHVHRLKNILTQIFGISHESPFEYKNTPRPSKYLARFHVELSNEDIYYEIAENFDR